MLAADTPDQIKLLQLISAKHAILLEAKGLRHSRLGRNGVKRLWAKHYGMAARTKHLDVIARMQQDINELAERIQPNPQQELEI